MTDANSSGVHWTSGLLVGLLFALAFAGFEWVFTPNAGAAFGQTGEESPQQKLDRVYQTHVVPVTAGIAFAIGSLGGHALLAWRWPKVVWMPLGACAGAQGKDRRTTHDDRDRV